VKKLQVTGFQVIDRGWDRIISSLRKAGHSFTKVGFPVEGSTSGRHSMQEVVSIAMTHEFGSPANNIPERSFLRKSIDENQEKISTMQVAAIRAVVDGTKTVRKALFDIGEEAKQMVVQKIVQGDADWPELSPKTIAKKGHAHMLVDTGQMRDTIQHKEVIYGNV